MRKRIALHESSTLNSSDSSAALSLSAAQKRIALYGEKSVLQLIRDIQKLNSQCRWIINQLHIYIQCGILLALVPQSLLQHYSVDRKDLLRYIDCVLVSAQESIHAQLLEIYHDCPSGDHWKQDKTLDLIHWRFTWPGITENVHEYVATCSVCQGKVIH